MEDFAKKVWFNLRIFNTVIPCAPMQRFKTLITPSFEDILWKIKYEGLQRSSYSLEASAYQVIMVVFIQVMQNRLWFPQKVSIQISLHQRLQKRK